MKRQWRLERIRAVEREFKVARLAESALRNSLQADPNLLFGEQLEEADAIVFGERLEATYLIRIFAEFEAGLRDWWRTGYGRATKPATEAFLNRVADIHSVPQDWRDAVHTVRRYRNLLVHEDAEPVPSIALTRARGDLCRYFSRIPLDW
jgi:hypothetical protein